MRSTLRPAPKKAKLNQNAFQKPYSTKIGEHGVAGDDLPPRSAANDNDQAEDEDGRSTENRRGRVGRAEPSASILA
jgi:hypothetical protein